MSTENKRDYDKVPAKFHNRIYKGLVNVNEPLRREILNYIGFNGSPPVWRNRSVESLENEIWKDIIEDSSYQCSSWGRFKRKHRTRTDTIGRVAIIKEIILVQYFNRDGYLALNLSKNGKKWLYLSHVEIGKVFLKNPKNKPQINHLIGVKCFNMAYNLEWATASENQNHAIINGLSNPRIGEKNGMSKLTNSQVLEIYTSKEPANQLSVRYNIKSTGIRRIRSGALWSKITGKQNIPKNLKSALVLAIYKCPLSIKDTATKYLIPYKQVHAIKRGISWGSLTGECYIPNKTFFHVK